MFTLYRGRIPIRGSYELLEMDTKALEVKSARGQGQWVVCYRES